MGVLIAGIFVPSAFGDPPAYLELSVKDQPQRGKLVAMDKVNAWLMSREGQLLELEVKDITGMKRLSPRFQPLSSAEVRDALRREFGKRFDIAGSEHYLVCAPVGKASEYAKLFEQIYRSFHGYFSVRGFRMAAPEFPLVAIVFPDHKSFDDYCKKDGFRAFRGLMGYYIRTTNRVALFDPGDGQAAISGDDPSASPGLVSATIEAGLADTMIHEATHQVAFNTGLHSRVGINPKWVVEGLATVFESPGIRESGSHRGKAFERINRERYVWFQGYAQSRRKPKSLATFISSDKLFETSALDAYAEGWALSFYLIETRPANYAKYLKAIASRDPVKDYSPEDRLADFKKAFGSDLDMLEADFLRFISRLED
jgi:hypothetical protein